MSLRISISISLRISYIQDILKDFPATATAAAAATTATAVAAATWATSGRRLEDVWETTGKHLQTSGRRLGDDWETCGRRRLGDVWVAIKSQLGGN